MRQEIFKDYKFLWFCGEQLSLVFLHVCMMKFMKNYSTKMTDPSYSRSYDIASMLLLREFVVGTLLAKYIQ